MGNIFRLKENQVVLATETQSLKDAFAVNDFNQLADKYINAPDELAQNAPVKHPNRNVHKGEEDKNTNS